MEPVLRRLYGRRLGVVLAALAAFVALIGFTPGAMPAAHAAPSCFAASCNGLNPQTHGCAADAHTADEFTYHGMRVELRASDACFATWTRFTTAGAPGIFFAQMLAWSAPSGGTLEARASVRVEEEDGSTFSSGFTVMWTFGDFNQACVSNSQNSTSGPCTARH